MLLHSPIRFLLSYCSAHACESHGFLISQNNYMAASIFCLRTISQELLINMASYIGNSCYLYVEK